MAVLLWPSSGDAALDRWTASVRAELHSHDAYLAHQQAADRRIARLQTFAAYLEDSVRSLQRAFTAEKQAADSLLARGDTAAAVVTLKQANAGCSLALLLCQQRGDSLNAALDTAKTARAAAETRATQADSLLHAGQQVTDCRVLLLKCPTRKEAFEAGTGVGVVLALILSWFAHR